jgi:hypothetical protein
MQRKRRALWIALAVVAASGVLVTGSAALGADLPLVHEVLPSAAPSEELDRVYREVTRSQAAAPIPPPLGRRPPCPRLRVSRLGHARTTSRCRRGRLVSQRVVERWTTPTGQELVSRATVTFTADGHFTARITEPPPRTP